MSKRDDIKDVESNQRYAEERIENLEERFDALVKHLGLYVSTEATVEKREKR